MFLHSIMSLTDLYTIFFSHSRVNGNPEVMVPDYAFAEMTGDVKVFMRHHTSVLYVKYLYYFLIPSHSFVILGGVKNLVVRLLRDSVPRNYNVKKCY